MKSLVNGLKSDEMMRLKIRNHLSRWAYCLTGLAISGVISLSVFYALEFYKLKDSFIAFELKQDGVEYIIVDQAPSNWVFLRDLPRETYGAIVVSEDWYFYEHNGIDFRQVKEAVKDYLDGEKLRGASTITQQFIKNLYLSSSRSFFRKAVEAYLAVIMEVVLDKEKILESYLNIIEFGQDLYGIGEASQFYFSKDAELMSSKEGAFLAMLLPNPKSYSSSYKEKKLSAFASETIASILKKMKVAGYISADQYKASLSESYIWERATSISGYSDSDYFDSF